MRSSVKIIAYVGLIACIILFGLSFRELYLMKVQKIPLDEGLSMMTPAFLGFLCLVMLAILIAHDVSNYIGEKAIKFIFDDEGEAIKTPEYEKAEDVWKNGDYLEAIRLMREYYEKHPREIYVAFRIAEIYENDLHNPLAAALEYEQILKNKLPPERWGWAAIHLVNLYGKLGQTDKGTALLQRIVEEYPKTAAAKKARERLGIPEPEPEPQPQPQEEIQEETEEIKEEKQKKSHPEPKLPPGFRPKKL